MPVEGGESSLRPPARKGGEGRSKQSDSVPQLEKGSRGNSLLPPAGKEGSA